MVRGLPKKENIQWINATYLSVDPIIKRNYYEPETFSRLKESITKNGFKEGHPLVIRLNRKKKKSLPYSSWTAPIRGRAKSRNKDFPMHNPRIIN